MKPSEFAAAFQPEFGLEDALTELLRSSAERFVATALEAETQALLLQHDALRIEDGRHAVVRNGYLPSRTLKTTLGDIKIRVPKVRDRSGGGVSFISRLLPPYFKTSANPQQALAWHFLQGALGGECSDMLSLLLDNPTCYLRDDTHLLLNESWRSHCESLMPKDLSGKRYLGWWANCVYRSGRNDDESCLLVITGATEEGGNELVGVQEGYRCSIQNWQELLASLQARGLETAPPLASGDGTLGIWGALSKLYPDCRHQYCWGHKLAEVMGKLPEPMLPVAKKALGAIWTAQTIDQAQALFDRTLMRLNSKCGKCSRCSEVADCLNRDRSDLLAFYDLPSEFWSFLRRPSLYSLPSLGGEQTRTSAPKTKPRSSCWLWPVSRPLSSSRK